VAAGRALGEVAAIDLAPTFTTLLGVGPPAQATGQPIAKALGNGAESTPAE
jgi:arylsulfatase A-like enzyme